MPEYPDITIYVERLTQQLVGKTLSQVRLGSPFLLRTVHPSLATFSQKKVIGFRRLGKRIVFEFEHELFLILHLMIAGRLRWKKTGVAIPKKTGLAAFDFDGGTLLFTEQGTKKRASLHAVEGERDLETYHRRALEVIACDKKDFLKTLQSENHTLKRALTDPRLFSGIGNAYSDEILHRARLSPLLHTQKMDQKQVEQLYQAIQVTLVEWTDRLRSEIGNRFPEKLSAFHPKMAVHGKFGQPCPVCETPVQRIRYAENETNYCPTCQTEGKLLADRAMSRLLKKDWPRSLEEMEQKLEAVSKPKRQSDQNHSETI